MEQKEIRPITKYLLTGLASLVIAAVGFIATQSSREANQDLSIKNHEKRIGIIEVKFESIGKDYSQMKTDIAVIKQRQESTEEAMARIETLQQRILDKIDKEK